MITKLKPTVISFQAYDVDLIQRALSCYIENLQFDDDETEESRAKIVSDYVFEQTLKQVNKGV